MSADELTRENASLREEIRQLQHAKEQLVSELNAQRRKAEEQVQHMAMMAAVASRASSTFNLRELLAAFMEDATQIMKAEASSLMLVDELTGDLVFEVATGERRDQVKSIRIRRGEGIAGWVAEHGETLLVRDAANDPRHAKQISRLVGFQTKSILCSPLRAAGRVIGVVQILNKTHTADGAFSDEDVPPFEAFADLMATSIFMAQASENLAELFEQTIQALIGAVDSKRTGLPGHSDRVARYSLAIADEMGLSHKDQLELRLAALFHNVGNIAREKPFHSGSEPLTDDEETQINRHSDLSYEIARTIRPLARSLPGIRSYRERYDGHGYPDGLAGDDIPLHGRIIAVANWFDLFTSDRAGQPRLAPRAAMQKMLDETSGSMHDPRIVRALASAFQKGSLGEIGTSPLERASALAGSE